MQNETQANKRPREPQSELSNNNQKTQQLHFVNKIMPSGFDKSQVFSIDYLEQYAKNNKLQDLIRECENYKKNVKHNGFFYWYEDEKTLERFVTTFIFGYLFHRREDPKYEKWPMFGFRIHDTDEKDYRDFNATLEASDWCLDYTAFMTHFFYKQAIEKSILYLAPLFSSTSSIKTQTESIVTPEIPNNNGNTVLNIVQLSGFMNSASLLKVRACSKHNQFLWVTRNFTRPEFFQDLMCSDTTLPSPLILKMQNSKDFVKNIQRDSVSKECTIRETENDSIEITFTGEKIGYPLVSSNNKHIYQRKLLGICCLVLKHVCMSNDLRTKLKNAMVQYYMVSFSKNTGYNPFFKRGDDSETCVSETLIWVLKKVCNFPFELNVATLDSTRCGPKPKLILSESVELYESDLDDTIANFSGYINLNTKSKVFEISFCLKAIPCEAIVLDSAYCQDCYAEVLQNAKSMTIRPVSIIRNKEIEDGYCCYMDSHMTDKVSDCADKNDEQEKVHVTTRRVIYIFTNMTNTQ